MVLFILITICVWGKNFLLDKTLCFFNTRTNIRYLMQVLPNGDRECRFPQPFNDGSPVQTHQKVVDVSPVIEWIHSLGLGRYEEAFIREEIDWDTLQRLTEEVPFLEVI